MGNRIFQVASALMAECPALTVERAIGIAYRIVHLMAEIEAFRNEIQATHDY